MCVVEQEELNHLFAHRKEANSNATEFKEKQRALQYIQRTSVCI